VSLPQSAHPMATGTVLFVDDDSHLLETVRSLMSQMSGGRWEILTATNAGRALRLLQERTIQLVVVDLRMPVMDGLQFLALVNRRYPNLHKAVLTGHATEEYRAACLAHGADLFLEKPGTPEEWEALHTSLNELLRWKPAEGFQGVLKRVGLEDILQMECLGGSSSVLEVAAGRAQGRIYIRDGALVHAAFQSFEGEPAFHQILRLQGGTFHLLPFEDPGKTTLEGSWEFLLMEAARLRDEAGAPPEPTPRQKPELAESGLVPPVEAASSDSPLVEPTPATGLAADAPGQSLPLPGPAREGLRPRIDQVLICSSRGEPLYEWQVKNSDFWVHFLEFVSRKARFMGQELGLGGFRRIVIEGGDERISAILVAEQVALVRAHYEDPTNPEPGSSRQGRHQRIPPSTISAGAVPPAFAAEVRDWLNRLSNQPGLAAVGAWLARQVLASRNWSDALSDDALHRTWRHLAEVIHVLGTHRLPTSLVSWSYERGAIRSVVRDDGLGMGLVTHGDVAVTSGAVDTLIRVFLS
jgi:CheY-like chemotaxis protein